MSLKATNLIRLFMILLSKTMKKWKENTEFNDLKYKKIIACLSMTLYLKISKELLNNTIIEKILFNFSI